MSQTVGELLTATLAELGVSQVFGVVGDALNPAAWCLRGNDGTGGHASSRRPVRGEA